MQTARFDLTHDPGSIYVSAFSARITAANGAWSAEQGAEFTTDIYVVADHEADIDSGSVLSAEGRGNAGQLLRNRPVFGSVDQTTVVTDPHSNC